ncbi:MAG TPA: tetratricopeptide repeat protein [Candidatus Acidoferrum sp.]|nr:tetratricopeptide repeat protein [Candidatus Acidoferrum sp.]
MRCPGLIIAAIIVAIARAAEKGYVDPALCRPCHSAIYDSYSKTGMGRSFGRALVVPRLEEFVHTPSRRSYRIVQREDGAHLQRTEIGGENLLERRIDFAIGSGAHSRTYVHRTSTGALMELPVSWYTADGGHWAMSPGYDRPDHSDFRREVTEACLFCHNGYPSEANGGLAEGIDCQRCHGPGEDHVKRQGPILNPAKLSPGRRMEVCLQCHLESASRTLPDAVRRFGRSTFSYRPSEALANWQLYFDFVRAADEDRITVNNSAYGLMGSKCFLNSGGRLTCSTCHDPHRAESAVNSTACRGCHASAHTPSTTGCTDCHMPKRRTEDAIHVRMTDHFIRKAPPTGDAPLVERHDRQTGPVRLFYPAQLPDTPEQRLYVAIATARNSANGSSDASKLAAAIVAVNPAVPEPYIELGDARRLAGDAKGAVAAYRQALDRGNREGRLYVAAGELLIQMSRGDEAMQLLESALREGSRDVSLRNTLAVLYGGRNRFPDALRLLEEALQLKPEEPLTWLNAGVAWQATGQKNRAEAAYREAIRLQPEFTRARRYLEALLKH